MDTVRIYFKVRDYSQWKEKFDEDITNGLLEGAGVTKYDLQRMVDTGELSLYFELKSSEQFKEYVKSSTCQNRMKEAGLTGTPRFEYMERLEEKPIGTTKKIA